MTQPRILLLEDDPRIALLVEMALEGLPVEFVHCATVPEAVQHIGEGTVTLFITDLMLPGESGLSLLERLPAVPGYSPTMLTLAFSAGLSADVRAKLEALGVWRVMSKPASMAALRACAEEAVVDAADKVAANLDDRDAAPPNTLPPRLAHVDDFFGGDMKLFAHFEQQCRAQFLHDIAEGNHALDGGDLAGLERLAHSLRPVLGTLGAADAVTLARQLETACRDADIDAARALWPQLRHQLPTPS
jgi:CheY-like chemotaxis protein